MIDYSNATEANEYQVIEKSSGRLMVTTYQFLTALKAQTTIADESHKPLSDFELIRPAEPLDMVPILGEN